MERNKLPEDETNEMEQIIERSKILLNKWNVLESYRKFVQISINSQINDEYPVPTISDMLSNRPKMLILIETEEGKISGIYLNGETEEKEEKIIEATFFCLTCIECFPFAITKETNVFFEDNTLVVKDLMKIEMEENNKNDVNDFMIEMMEEKDGKIVERKIKKIAFFQLE